MAIPNKPIANKPSIKKSAPATKIYGNDTKQMMSDELMLEEPVISKRKEASVNEVFFGSDFWASKEKVKSLNTGTTIHDQAQQLQIASIVADVLDEVRFEYRMSCIKRGYINPGELARPFFFKVSQLVEWMRMYYDKYHLKNTPDCFFAGTEDPKITTNFLFYHRAGYFSSPILLGKLLSKQHEVCGICLANTAGNSNQWLLNPPPTSSGEKEIVVEQDPDQEEEELS